MSLLINNISIITMDGKDKLIENGYILVNGNSIEEVGKGEYEGPISRLKVVNGEGCVAMPGLINMHTHVPMTLLRGYGEGLPLMKWLEEKIWPFEDKMTKDDIYIGSLLGIVEMIKSGTTTFVDMYYKIKQIASAATDLNCRAFLGNTIIGEEYDRQIEKTIELRDKLNNDLITVTFAPHAPYTCSTEALVKVGEVARKENIPIQIHLSETEEEVDNIYKTYGKTPIEHCKDLDLYKDNNIIAAHCVHVTDDDVRILKDNNVTVVNNPQSNMKLASGIAPLVNFLKEGVNVCLGTDGASSNNNLNMIEEMQTASLIQKVASEDATFLDAYEVLSIGTLNAAKALGMENSLGKIKKGYLADIILIDMTKPHLIPNYNTYTNIVYSAQGSDVKTVVINGKVVMKDYKLKLIDETILKQRVENSVNSILRKL